MTRKNDPFLSTSALSWGVLGCGGISHEFAAAMAICKGRIHGVANRTYEKAVQFAKDYDVQKVYRTTDELCEDASVDVIYVATPHNKHIEALRKILSAGKHVLVEKSITLNSAELDEAVALAKKHGVCLAEAQTIYHMPVYKTLLARVANGDFGRLNLLQINFGSYKPYDMKNRFFNPDLAGGAILDIGVYALSFARTFMTGMPTGVLSQLKKAPSGVDEEVGILLQSEKELATIILSLHSKQPKRALLSFDKAYVELMEYPRGERATITWTEDGREETIEAGRTAHALSYEILDMERAITTGDGSILKLDHTIDVMKIMTDIRKTHGILYPEEM